MFKHILLPTDGSPLSESAMHKTLEFAKSIGAKVTAFHVVPQYHKFSLRGAAQADTEENFSKQNDDRARDVLAVVEQASRERQVVCEMAYATSDHPYEEIINFAREKNCDLIAMASHGRRGLQSLLLGSETHKVLTHSKIPVLIFY